MVALGQVAEMQLEGVATGTRQLDGIHHRDAPVLSGEFHTDEKAGLIPGYLAALRAADQGD